MDLKDVTRIYIIESPSEIDILDNRKEGFALSELLRLADIENKYYQVSCKESLLECLRRIISVENDRYKNHGFITLHFSMHGNEDGIKLTHSELISWKELYEDYLKNFNLSLGYEKSKNGNIVAPIHLHFSTCKGYYGKKIKDYSEHSPYISLVGPIEKVGWSDSLLAFITFYHNTIHKPIGPELAAKKMNDASNLINVFKVDLAKNFNFITPIK
jgi:hypothetical protein